MNSYSPHLSGVVVLVAFGEESLHDGRKLHLRVRRRETSRHEHAHLVRVPIIPVLDLYRSQQDVVKILCWTLRQQQAQQRKTYAGLHFEPAADTAP